MTRFNVKVSGKSIETFEDTIEGLKKALAKAIHCKILGLDVKLYKERLELQEDPVVLDRVWKVVESEQIG
jgi:hypothetical protein